MHAIISLRQKKKNNAWMHSVYIQEMAQNADIQRKPIEQTRWVWNVHSNYAKITIFRSLW